jgi:hypothetical protein
VDPGVSDGTGAGGGGTLGGGAAKSMTPCDVLPYLSYLILEMHLGIRG